jgi:hypothetical protein
LCVCCFRQNEPERTQLQERMDYENFQVLVMPESINLSRNFQYQHSQPPMCTYRVPHEMVEQ